MEGKLLLLTFQRQKLISMVRTFSNFQLQMFSTMEHANTGEAKGIIHYTYTHGIKISLHLFYYLMISNMMVATESFYFLLHCAFSTQQVD
jgi:hypothetical protein